MACSLISLAAIDDLTRIRAVLLPHLLDSIIDTDYPTTETDGTDDDDDDEAAPTSESVARTAALLPLPDKKKKKKSSLARNEWLNECLLAFSPVLDILVAAFDQQMMVFTAKNKTSNRDQGSFTASFDKKLQVESNERITSLLCLPIASTTKRHTPEWTCIIVGFTTGYVRMYTEEGILLFSQLFHDESVIQLKCHTQFPSLIRGLTEQPDELYIQYRSSILVAIDGLSLYQLLKVCRDHALKSPNALASPQLSFKKWGFPDQDQIFDFAPAGLITDNRFDQLCVAAMTGGYQAQIRSVPPLFTRLITIGSNPYCNFYYCAEGAQTPHLTEVAFALADKVKTSFISAVSRWIPTKQASASEESRKPKIEPETKLTSRFGIRDLRRHGEKIIVSPGLHVAAVCDSFGRIIVYDIHRGVAIRMFKGYREAEIGFIQIEETTTRDGSMSSSARKSALFLIIHAPRRQLVEIWGCQQGARVAAFNVSKNSHLIYLEHSTFGWLSSGAHSSKLAQYKQCILLEENGEIKTFQIPFHLILSDRNNQRAHDLMVVRQVRRFIKETSSDNDLFKHDFHQQIKRLITFESRCETLDLLFHADFVDLQTMRMFIDETKIDLENNAHHANPQDVLHAQDFCRNSLHLLDIYTAIEHYRTDDALVSMNNEGNRLTEEDLQNELGLTAEETSVYYRLFERYNTATTTDMTNKKVRFVDHSSSASALTFGQFQSMFLFTRSSRPSNPVDNEQYRLELKSTINTHDFSLLGAYLFSPWLCCKESTDNEEKFRSFLRLTHLKADDLALLCVHTLLSSPLILPTSLRTWKQLLTIVCSTNSRLLKTVFEKTSNGITSLLLALILRSNNDDNWTLLIRRLSALVAVQNVFSSLENKIESSESSTIRANDLTVESIFIRHRHDYLLELIAHHIIDSSVDPAWLTTSSSNENPFQINPSICRQILPHTFEPTVLLVHCCWTSMVLWKKQLTAVASSTSSSPSNSSSRNSNDLFQLALDFYNRIQIGLVKQNLGTLLWHTYLRSRIVILTQLIEKIGKIPKDRLCYKELRLTEKELIIFLEQLSENFFKNFIESIYQLNEIPIFNVDDVWQSKIIVQQPSSESLSPFINLFSSSSKLSSSPLSSIDLNEQNISLLELVMEQKPVNDHLVLHHDKLIRILYYLMEYHMKSIRPYSLFDSKGINAFFTDLHSHPLVTDDVDSHISNRRQLFFARLLNTIFEQNEKNAIDSRTFDAILRLATDMLVEHEYIRRHYISLLYAYGYDQIAINEENRVHDRQSLAFQLLIIAGLRLNYIIGANTEGTKLSLTSLEVRAKLSSTLKTWIGSVGSLVDYPVRSCSLTDIEMMLTRISCYLPETNLSQSNLAQEMVELVRVLKR